MARIRAYARRLRKDTGQPTCINSGAFAQSESH